MKKLLFQIRTLQEKVNVLYEKIECYHPETASSSGMFHVPSQPMWIPSPWDMLTRDSALSRCAQNSMGFSGVVFGNHLLQKELLRPRQELSWDMEKWLKSRIAEFHRPRDSQGILVLGIPHVVPEELMFKIVRWKLRDMLSPICISENSQVQMTFSDESLLQERSVRKHINSWTDHVMDQWSGDGWNYIRSYDVVKN